MFSCQILVLLNIFVQIYAVFSAFGTEWKFAGMTAAMFLQYCHEPLGAVLDVNIKSMASKT